MKIINSNKENYDIILVAGQSNAESCGKGAPIIPWTPQENIHMLKNEFVPEFLKDENGFFYVKIDAEKDAHIEIAQERKGETPDKDCGVFALQFAERYAKNYLKAGRKVLIVHTAVGGTGFARKDWGVGDVIYNRMMDMADSALNMGGDNKFVAFLWHQGEHDADFPAPNFNYDENYAKYKKNVFAVFSAVREKFGKDLPIIAGDFCYEWASQLLTKCQSVSNATIDVLKEMGNSGFVQTTDLKSNNQVLGDGDIIHFCRASLEILGERYFNEFKKIKDIIKQ